MRHLNRIELNWASSCKRVCCAKQLLYGELKARKGFTWQTLFKASSVHRSNGQQAERKKRSLDLDSSLASIVFEWQLFSCSWRPNEAIEREKRQLRRSRGKTDALVWGTICWYRLLDISYHRLSPLEAPLLVLHLFS